MMRLSVGVLTALVLLQSAGTVCAQSQPAQGSTCRPAVRPAVGALQPYLDEPWQVVGGGSVRACVTQRVSVEPEVLVSPGSHFSRWMVASNVLVDLVTAKRSATPYALGGIGYAREQDTHVEWHRSYLAWYGGVGVRVRATDAVFIAPEFRIGDDLGVFVVGIGYQFGRR